MWNRMDICEAFYLYASHYHRGQGSKEYAIFGRLARMGFRAGAGLRLEGLSEGGRLIYEALVAGDLEVR